MRCSKRLLDNPFTAAPCGDKAPRPSHRRPAELDVDLRIIANEHETDDPRTEKRNSRTRNNRSQNRQMTRPKANIPGGIRVSEYYPDAPLDPLNSSRPVHGHVPAGFARSNGSNGQGKSGPRNPQDQSPGRRPRQHASPTELITAPESATPVPPRLPLPRSGSRWAVHRRSIPCACRRTSHPDRIPCTHTGPSWPESHMPPPPKDLTGHVTHDLVVLHKAGRDSFGHQLWTARCSRCGRTLTRTASNLLRLRSCGRHGCRRRKSKSNPANPLGSVPKEETPVTPSPALPQ